MDLFSPPIVQTYLQWLAVGGISDAIAYVALIETGDFRTSAPCSRDQIPMGMTSWLKNGDLVQYVDLHFASGVVVVELLQLALIKFPSEMHTKTQPPQYDAYVCS